MARKRFETWNSDGKDHVGETFARSQAVWDNKLKKTVKVSTEWLKPKSEVDTHIQKISPVVTERCVS